MEPEGSRSHLKVLSNNPYLSGINQIPRILVNSYFLSFQLRLDIPKGLFPLGIPVKILKAFLHSSFLATCPVHFNLLVLIGLTILGEPIRLVSFIKEG